MAPTESQMPFIRNLASSDRNLRTASLDSLRTFLSSRHDLAVPDALKLWKGLYYALWMTDRPKPQQALAEDLAALLFTLRGSVRPQRANKAAQAATDTPQITWLRAFWAAIASEWTSIDVLRMDKFLLLVRRVFAAHIRLARSQSYDPAVTDPIISVLSEWPFEPDCDLRKVPLGLRLHVLDLWVDELEREGVLEDEQQQEQQQQEHQREPAKYGLSRAFVGALGSLVDSLRGGQAAESVRMRAQESYEDERLPWATSSVDDDDATGEEEEGWCGIRD